MQERVLKLDDLSEFEQKHLRQQAEDADNPQVELRGDDRVVIRDDAEASVDDADPRDGVDAGGVEMTDEVADILEEPFKSRQDPEDREEPSEYAKKEEEEKPFEPDPGDVRNFIRCMLGNKRFVKEYSAYGGAMTFTLGARTHAQDEDVVFGCANMDQMHAMAHMTNMRLVYSLVDLRVGDEHTTYPAVEPGQQVPIGAGESGDLADQAQAAQKTMPATEKRLHEIRQLPQAVFGVLSTSMHEFDMLVTVLTQRASDPKHWATASAD